MGDHSIEKKCFNIWLFSLIFELSTHFIIAHEDLLGFVNFPIWILQCAHKLDYVEQAGKTAQIVPIEIGMIQHREKSNISTKQWKDQIEIGIPHTFFWNYCHIFWKGCTNWCCFDKFDSQHWLTLQLLQKLGLKWLQKGSVREMHRCMHNKTKNLVCEPISPFWRLLKKPQPYSNAVHASCGCLAST